MTPGPRTPILAVFRVTMGTNGKPRSPCLRTTAKDNLYISARTRVNVSLEHTDTILVHGLLRDHNRPRYTHPRRRPPELAVLRSRRRWTWAPVTVPTSIIVSPSVVLLLRGLQPLTRATAASFELGKAVVNPELPLVACAGCLSSRRVGQSNFTILLASRHSVLR